MTATEYVVLVDTNNKQIGVAEKLSAHQHNLLHRAFSVFIFRQTLNGIELLLQQRAFDKYHSPGLWTNTCCSHPRDGEDIIEAGQRRLKEEIGITATLIDLGWFHYNAHFKNGLSENEIDHVLLGIVPHHTTIQLNLDEAHAYRWVSMEDLEQELKHHPERFTFWLKQALKITKTEMNKREDKILMPAKAGT